MNISRTNADKNQGVLVFDNAQTFDHFKINASEINSDLCVSLSQTDDKNKIYLDADYAILLGGWEDTGLDFNY